MAASSTHRQFSHLCRCHSFHTRGPPTLTCTCELQYPAQRSVPLWLSPCSSQADFLFPLRSPSPRKIPTLSPAILPPSSFLPAWPHGCTVSRHQEEWLNLNHLWVSNALDYAFQIYGGPSMNALDWRWCFNPTTACACLLSRFSHVQLFVTLQTIANQAPLTHQASLSMGFSRQEYWSGLPCPPPGDLPDPGTEPRSLFGFCFLISLF